MTKIKLVVDSTTDLTRDFFLEHGISSLPLSVYFGTEEFLDGIDITPGDFYQKLRHFSGFPTTSQVNPQAFRETFSELAEETDIILSMHLSGKLSGTLDSARIAAQEIPDTQIICYDSESASLGYGFQVVEAVRAIEAGCDLSEVLKRIKQVRESMRIYFAVSSLDHLHKGGRIGKAGALLGGLLNIVPLLTLEDGMVIPAEKIRGKKRVPKRLLELVGEGIAEFGGSENLNLAVLHTDYYSNAIQLREQIAAEYQIKDIPITQVGTIIGTHIGPGVLAVIFHQKNY